MNNENVENVIEVKNIKKSFKIFYDKGHTLKEKALFSNRRKYEERKVLNGISFEVKKGEAIGLIGHNGCGKSTTLKLLTRIMYPDSGSIEMRGRVSSLIELGAGFHPDMSGRENIYINAAIFGLTKKEIDKRIDDIIAFSELGEYIDNPVRTYSSGMYMRLAFAVAINVDADILLIDEILGVGDAGFQVKCFQKLREIKASGTTIVIVSHALGQIEQICERSYWIHGGVIRMVGKPLEVHPVYMDYMMEERVRLTKEEEERKKAEQEEIQREEENNVIPIDEFLTDNEEIVIEEEASEEESLSKQENRWGNKKAEISKVSMKNRKGEVTTALTTGEQVTIAISYNVKETVRNAVFGIGIFRDDGVNCYGTNTRIDNLAIFDLTSAGVCEVTLESLNLLPGRYSLDIAIECDNGIPVDYFRYVIWFDVFSPIGDVGVARIEHKWKV